MSEKQRYRAVLHDLKGMRGHVKSIWFDTEEQANLTGQTGLAFYGAKRYTVEPKLTQEGQVIKYEQD